MDINLFDANMRQSSKQYMNFESDVWFICSYKSVETVKSRYAYANKFSFDLNSQFFQLYLRCTVAFKHTQKTDWNEWILFPVWLNVRTKLLVTLFDYYYIKLFLLLLNCVISLHACIYNTVAYWFLYGFYFYPIPFRTFDGVMLWFYHYAHKA